MPRVSFGIKTTEAPHFHRVLAQRGTPVVMARPAAVPGTGVMTDPRRGIGRAGRAVTDGNGVVFVDHVGNVYPSGFLPLPVGNVRADDVVALYREHPLFRALRDPRVLRGRCGRCQYRDTCGGSRARAFALAGSAFGEDPGCAWEPALAESERHAATPAPIAGGSDAAVTPVQVTDALRAALDPELGMSVVDLGLVYGIEIDGGVVRITATVTAPGCPLHEVMTTWMREAVAELPAVERVAVTLTFDPPWTPERIVPPR